MSTQKGEFKDISGLSKVAVISLIVQVVVTSLLALFELGTCFLGPLPQDTEKWDLAQALVTLGETGFSILMLVVMIVNIVAICRWMYFTYRNLEAADLPYLTHTPNSAIFYWFIPFACLFKPYQVMKEIYTASGSRSEWNASAVFQTAHPIFHIWWACWLLSGFIGNLSFSLSKNEELSVVATGAAFLSSLVSIVAAIALIRILREATERQQSNILKIDSKTI